MISCNARQRMARALRGEETDRPVLAYLFLGGARHVLDRPMCEVYTDSGLMTDAQRTAAELFGHDSSMMPWGCLTVEAEAFGCTLDVHDHFYPQVATRPLEEDPDLGRLTRPDPATTGCEIPFKTPVDNIRALAKAVRAGF